MKIIKSFGLRYFTLFLILFSFAQIYCQKLKIPKNIQIFYSEGGGLDVYRKGQRTGMEIHVLFSGEYQIYRTYFKSKPILERVGYLEKKRFDSLKYYFNKVKFLDFPDILPRTNQFFVPAPTCLIGYRKNKTDKIKMVEAILAQKKKYYPTGFFKLNSKLESILFPK